MLCRLPQKIAACRWAQLPAASARSAKFRLDRRISAFYRNHLLTSAILARAFPFRQPPILLISYPRSGSSWIGKMLSFSPDLAYLREPVHQAFQTRYKVQALLDPEDKRPTLCCHRQFDEPMLEYYLWCADRAFQGIVPPEPAEVLDNDGDFRFLARRCKTLLIKEVNPLMTEYFVRRYAPRTVVILRHPAAVADSFLRLGWLEGDILEDFGYLYGVHLQEAIEAARPGWSLVIEYEDFARQPQEHFSRLIATLGVQQPIDFSRIIANYCSHRENSDHPYEIRRSSLHEVDKWQQNLSSVQAEAVMRGYSRCKLAHYRQGA